MPFFDITASGRKIDYLNPQPYQFEISEIVRAMANTCRLAGQAKFTLAQHCYMMSQLVPLEHAKEAMLYHAAKAYCGDLPPGLKELLPEYGAIVRRVDAAIRAQFLLPPEPTESVETASRMIISAAKRDLMPRAAFTWPAGLAVYRRTITPMSSSHAKGLWSARWLELCAKAIETERAAA